MPAAEPAAAARGPARAWNLASGLLLLVVLGVMLATFLDYGITLDEGVQNRYGRRLVRAYATLGRDASATSQNDLFLYGGLFELVVQAVAPWSGLGTYEGRHLVNALFGFLGLLAAWGLASHLGGAAAGFLAILALALTPGYYGHAFANPKDIPFASLYALGAWCVLRAGEHPTWRRVLAAGVAIGLASAVRVAGIALVAFAAVLWLARLALRRAEGGRAAAPRRELAAVLLALLATLAVAWLLMVAFWPWALLDPVRHPLQAWGRFAHFWNTDVLWKGRLVPSEQLPRTYLVQMLALKLPEFHVVGWLLGLASLVAAWRRLGSRPAGEAARLCQGLWLGLLAAAPIGWAVLARTPLYHECRHFLFVVPLLAVLGALGLAAFLVAAPRPARLAAALVWGALALVTLVDMVQLHPYQYVYYNRLVAGGLARAAERYETDYYVASYREGIDWIVARYAPRAGGERVRVAAPLTGFPVAYELNRSEERRRRFEPVLMGQDPHLVLASSSYRERDRISGKLVHVVARQAAPLLYVLEVRPPR